MSISKVKSLLFLDVLLCLCNSSVMSSTQYSTIVWGNTSAFYTDLVYELQKKLVQIISSQSAHSPSAPIFESRELFRLSDVFQLKLLLFVFQTVTRISLSYFHDFFLI